MEKSLLTVDMDVAQENSIDNIIEDKMEEIKMLREEYSRLLKINERNKALLKDSVTVDEINTSLLNELNLFDDTEASVCSEYQAAYKFVDELREKTLSLKSEQSKEQERGSAKVVSFENILSEKLVKFRDALTLYSDDYLMKEIEDIGNKRLDVKNKIENVDQNIKALVPNSDEMVTIGDPGREPYIKELEKLKPIWMESKLARVSERKLYRNSNKELEGKIKTNETKIAQFV